MYGGRFRFLIRFPRSINTPIRMLMDGIMEIANHNYEKRLDLTKYDEFEGVAKSFNRMAERLTEYRKVRWRILSKERNI